MKNSSIMMAGCALALGTLCSTPTDANAYFHSTEVQLHADFARDKGFQDENGADLETDILTTTFVHVSEWKYGDVFGFFDIEGEDDYKIDAAQYYGEFATRFSLDKIILGAEKGNNMLGSFLKETYIKVEYNGGAPVGGYDYIDDALLYGISFDLNLGQPNFGFTNVSLQVKDFTAFDEKVSVDEMTGAETTISETSWQFTLAWGQPFSIGSVNFDFQGFFDIWEYNDELVVLTEPQIRLKLDSFVGKDNFLSDSAIGMEFEISSRFFSQANDDLLINPTIFWVTKF